MVLACSEQSRGPYGLGAGACILAGEVGSDGWLWGPGILGLVLVHWSVGLYPMVAGVSGGLLVVEAVSLPASCLT